MAYPASTKTLQLWITQVDQRASAIKTLAEQQRAASLAGTLNMQAVAGFFDQCVGTNNFFIAAAAVPGIAAYLIEQKQNAVADPIAEFTAMRNALLTVLNWLQANVPQGEFPASSGNFYKLAVAFPTDDVTLSSPLTFTAAQTASYRTQLDALIATIS